MTVVARLKLHTKAKIINVSESQKSKSQSAIVEMACFTRLTLTAKCQLMVWNMSRVLWHRE